MPLYTEFFWTLGLELDGVGNGWTDVTSDVSLGDGPIEITDGIGSTSPVDLLANPGSISFILDNSGGNSARANGYYSPGHGSCREGFTKNIRVQLTIYTYDGVELYPYLRGIYWLQKPIPSAGVYGEAITRCKATDWLDLASNLPMPAIGVQTEQRGDQLVTTLLAGITPAPDLRLETGGSIFKSAFDADDVSRDTVYSILGKIARSEYGRIYMKAGNLYFEGRNTRLANMTSLGTISDVMDGVGVIDDAGMVYDRFQVKITPKRVTPSVITLATLDDATSLAPNEEIEITLNYVDADSGNKISGSDIVTPVESTDYKFGSSPDPASEDLNGDLVVTMESTGSNSSDIKLKNAGASSGYVNLFQLRGYGIYANNPVTVEAGTGGMRVQSLEMPYQTNVKTAQAVANHLQSVTSDNALKACRINFMANKSSALMLAAITGEISTRWTIQETQTGMDGDYFVNGRKWTISLGNRLEVEWLMVPAGTEAVWIVDEGEPAASQMVETMGEDCDGSDGGGFSDTRTWLQIGNVSAGDWPSKAWIGFLVDMNPGLTIVSALVRFRASRTRTGGTVKLLIGCEAADSPSMPTSWADLDSREMTEAYTTLDNVPTWTEGVEYTLDVTSAIQEIINAGYWTNGGNPIGILIWDNGSTPDADRQIASHENGTYAEPVLEIVAYGD